MQPDSSQDCLIGMNAAPALGLSFLDRNGIPLRMAGSVPVTTASVNLIRTKAIPARSRSFVEPDPCSLETHGLGALESLVSVNSQGKVLIPVMNYHQRDVYLEEGTLLGQAELLLESAEHDLTDVVGLPEGEGTCMDAAHVAVVTGEQPRKLLDIIQWPVSVAPRNNDK